METIKEKVLRISNRIMLKRVLNMKGDHKDFNEKTDFFQEKEHIVNIAVDETLKEVLKIAVELINKTTMDSIDRKILLSIYLEYYYWF
ncbi:hypothetical protein LCGC14_2724510 [marine sediment metagenome]|uniref:Uncharacterized protein n=1 Tax=marine sediment metagenome TaxID=412755 RepID=A0A0F8XGU3_9ZZZZ